MVIGGRDRDGERADLLADGGRGGTRAGTEAGLNRGLGGGDRFTGWPGDRYSQGAKTKRGYLLTLGTGDRAGQIHRRGGIPPRELPSRGGRGRRTFPGGPEKPPVSKRGTPRVSLSGLGLRTWGRDLQLRAENTGGDAPWGPARGPAERVYRHPGEVPALTVARSEFGATKKGGNAGKPAFGILTGTSKRGEPGSPQTFFLRGDQQVVRPALTSERWHNGPGRGGRGCRGHHHHRDDFFRGLDEQPGPKGPGCVGRRSGDGPVRGGTAVRPRWTG